MCGAEELDEVHARIERGEFVDADTFFADLTGVSKEQFLRRLRERPEGLEP